MPERLTESIGQPIPEHKWLETKRTIPPSDFGARYRQAILSFRSFCALARNDSGARGERRATYFVHFLLHHRIGDRINSAGFAPSGGSEAEFRIDLGLDRRDARR